MSPAADAVIRRLDGARQKWWLFTLLTTSVLAACASFGSFLLLMLCDSVLRLSQIALWGAFLGWLLLTAALLVVVGRRLVRSQRSLEAAARRVECGYPELGSDLINLVQLAEDTRNQNRAFCQAAVDHAAARVGQFPFHAAATRQSRRRRLLNCMQTPRDLGEALLVFGMLVTIAVLAERCFPNWASAASRVLTPWRFVPSVGSVEILGVTPGDADVLIGSSLKVTAQIRNPGARPYKATLFAAAMGEREAELPMTTDKQQERFEVTVPSVVKPLKYRLEIGDSQTPIYAVGVRDKPTVVEVEVKLHLPAYLGSKDETFSQKHADLDAPQYTVAELKIHTAVPIAKGYLQMEGERLTGRVEADGMVLAVDALPLLRDGTFTIRLFDDGGHSDPDPRVNRVHVVPDRPPVVELLKPPRQSAAAPGTSVPVMLRASDDHGIGRLRLETKVVQGEAAPDPNETSEDGQQAADSSPPGADAVPATKLCEWTDCQGDTTVVRQYAWELKPDELKPGQSVLIRAVAWDQRLVNQWGLDLRPQQSTSGWHVIHIIAPETKAAAALTELDKLRAAITHILEKQVRARVAAAAILKADNLPERSDATGRVRIAQVEIQQATDALVNSLGAAENQSHQTIRRTLNNLAVGEMLDAVRYCDALLKLPTAEAFAEPVPRLWSMQERIIDVLRKLLGFTRQAQDALLSEMKKRPGGNLPDDVRKKFEEAANKLDEFLKQQKKVVEASENLAKTPVEDFTAKEDEKLKGLAAAEDDWSRFMTELQTDLSKLPEQDFANSSLAKELVEIQTELKMAEDALLKKSVDIAVPLEQLGYEKAEELKTNLEKWLPDTPDREKWSQEEALSDEDKRAPMAELPGELEDLVGELMEQEEDLFDEMEDVSSSAADSLDKGAGWDAMDGPISNFSAKGVTGNRLPNDSEIGGRSGEGRSGKSSGEFVGDEAVGKGGRKTPSRLTPDPYVKGQIKDHSKDPTGGATGGGKESGQGGEGLQGPPPAAPAPRDLERLAGKQAALRNKAEGIDLRLQVANFHHTDLQKLIELMAQVERDLQSGRYQNAVRQRKVLVDGMGNVKQYLDGEFRVRQDATSNLPKDIQKEILGSMQDPSPAGWEELNRQYFERLSHGEPNSRPAAAAAGKQN